MSRKIDLRLILALLGVAVLWGTTYLAIRVAVQTIPPWFVTAMRQGFAALILLVILLRKKEFVWLSWPNLKRNLILSSLMLVIANGLTTVGEKTIPSGLTSLIAALSPLLVFIGSVSIGLQKPSLKGFFGVLIGFLGVAFIFREGLGDLLDPNYRMGILSLFVAISGWAAGTIYTKKYSGQSANIFVDLFYQFTFAAFVQLILAFIFSDSYAVTNWSLHSFAAVLYLAVFGSVIGYFCYLYALKRVTAIEVSILSYLNTVIALFLGWLILDEVITTDFLIATVLIIFGVFITNYKKEH
jgi:drug/metabolite transporter (DMT)-like permease